MKGDGEREDESPSREDEEEAQRESQPEPIYDPLLEPWNDPALTSIAEYRPPEQPKGRAFPPSARPDYTGFYSRTEELSELRRRLMEETVVVPKRQRVWAVTIRDVVETLLLAVLIFLAVRASMQNFRVEGASMEPSLDNGEYLIVNKLAYTQIDLSIFDWLPFFDSGDDPVHHLWDSPSRGDVIVFRSPTNVERDFIKRIIGVPGDVVEIDPGRSAVKVNETFIDEQPYIVGMTTCQSSCGPWQVPADSYFVMGDNRQNSSDSRQGWFVPEENIIGKALITYWHHGSPELDLAPNHEISIAKGAAAEE